MALSNGKISEDDHVCPWRVSLQLDCGQQICFFSGFTWKVPLSLLPRGLKTCSAAPDQKTLLLEPEIFPFTEANEMVNLILQNWKWDCCPSQQWFSSIGCSYCYFSNSTHMSRGKSCLEMSPCEMQHNISICQHGGEQQRMAGLGWMTEEDI